MTTNPIFNYFFLILFFIQYNNLKSILISFQMLSGKTIKYTIK